MLLKKLLSFCLIIFSCNFMLAIDKDDLSNRVKSEAARELISKYPLKLVGFGGGAVYGVRVLSLSFEVKKNVTIDEARKLILDCAEIFLEKINNDHEIRPYLSEYPYPVSRIKLRFFVTPLPPFVGKSNLSTFGIYHIPRKKQTFLDYNVDDDPVLKEIFSETYEEAVERAKTE